MVVWQRIPKTQDISKLSDKQNDEATEQSASWTGYKTPQLKPAWEPCLCFRAPRQGNTYANLATKYGSGCLNIDGSRIGTNDEYEMNSRGFTNGMLGDPEKSDASTDHPQKPSGGRFPANLLLDETTAPMLGASRFFYCAKSSTSEREAGLTNEKRPGGSTVNGFTEDKTKGNDRNKPVHNNHPCVKPINLTKYLATLLLPPSSVENRRLLVPFSGSGSEMIGAIQAGWDEVIGVEMDKHYCEIAQQRCEHAVLEEEWTLF